MRRLFGTIFFVLGVIFCAHSQSNNRSKIAWSEKELDAFIEKSELIPIQITGDKDNRINIVIINQWTSKEKAPYNTPEMRGEFVKDIEESLFAALTYGDERAQTAYANYKEFFNVYGFWAPHTPEFRNGIEIENIDAIREKLFLPWKDEHKGWVTFLIMPNLENGGGGAARNLEARVGNAVIAGNGIGKMLHEISHTCMSLGDEYTTHQTGTDAFPTYSADINYERNKVKWRKWIEPTTPVPTPYEAEYLDKIGAFEGNQYHLVDYFRSTAQGCIMGAGIFDNTEEMCPPCNQRVSMRVYDLVDPINSFVPENTSIEINGQEKIKFSVDHIKPEPNTQVVRWFLNEKLIATGVDELEVEFGAISKYKLVCEITDETPNIRPDPPYARFPKFEVKWNVNNSAPTSNSNKQLSVKLNPKQKDKNATFSHSIESKVIGGVPPYSYKWSNGSTENSLNEVGVGVYDLTVIDSEYSTVTAKSAIYKSSVSGKLSKPKKTAKNKSDIQVVTNVKASEIGKGNGSLVLDVKGAVEPYKVQWKNADYTYGESRIYEAENGVFDISGYEMKSLSSASNNSYVSFKGNEGEVSWNIEVGNSGIYPIDIIYGGIQMNGSTVQLKVNGKLMDKNIQFAKTLPLYTGWAAASVNVFLTEGENKLSLQSIGESIPNINYLRVPTSVTANTLNQKELINLKGGDYDYVVIDADNNTLQGSVQVPEVYPFKINDVKIKSDTNGTISIVAPIDGYTYKWYANDAPLTKGETYEKPLKIGTSFKPQQRGNYYVSAQNKLSKAESSNRIGIAIDDVSNKRAIAISPSEIGNRSVKLWLDASDIDGNGSEDSVLPLRGPVKAWKSKTWRTPNDLFIKYEPNTLNGKGVAAFDKVWVESMENEIKDFHTVIMVYKESSVSTPGTSLYRGLNQFIGKSKDHKKSMFDIESIDDRTKNGEVYLNGEKINPFTTPNPMDYCILTVQLASPSDVGLKRTEGLWEGAIAELIVIDRKLTEWERKGIEEYLRRKWFSTIDIEFK
ncbi:M64 family metallo-endopeptidase [Cellulophaga sp. F20128]|uniref:M64 family metallopeptidase n=1 Tax=Cellulophaga sp. F20128 TaxID=2926413 RepID=UPI001FF46764|nr:M64 family metallopeptidase [Cellulophaga sp. F20128]MCK0156457.1 M64 family metallo-endopeptidase [Cellulophaga sp. F20128]